MSASGDDLGPACWICHDHALAIEAGAHSAGPLLRACACRGPDASFSHLACLVEYAQHAGANRATSQGTSWSQCPTCKQDYTGELQLGLARARWELVRGRAVEDGERRDAMGEGGYGLWGRIIRHYPYKVPKSGQNRKRKTGNEKKYSCTRF